MIESRVKALAETGLGYREITRSLKAEGFPVGETRVRRILREVRAEHGIAKPKNGNHEPLRTSQLIREGAGDSLTLESPKGSIRTLDELLDAAKVDLELWEVERWTANVWEQHSVKAGTVPLWQVKAWLKRRREVLDIRTIRDEAVAAMQAHSPSYPKLRYQIPSERHMLQVNVADLHVGKLGWVAETGENYDLEIAEARFKAAVTDLLNKTAGFGLDKILFALTGDTLHVDNAQNSTAKGTPQDVDSRYQKAFRVALRALVWAVDQMLDRAPVELVVIPGNHDELTGQMLAETLAAWYRNTPSVTVDGSLMPRRYVRYGVNLIGLAHGHNERHADLPLIMAGDVPELWAQTRYRAFCVGHFHHKALTEFRGVEVRITPSLSGTDAWHAKQGYRSLKAAEALLWHPATGLNATFFSNVLEAA